METEREPFDWEGVRAWATVIAFVAGCVFAWPYAHAFANELRCNWRLRGYLAKAVPAQRSAEVDRCKMPDAAAGYCFVSALGDDGLRRAEAIPVAIRHRDGIDAEQFVNDAVARARDGNKVPLAVVEDALLTYISKGE